MNNPWLWKQLLLNPKNIQKAKNTVTGANLSRYQIILQLPFTHKDERQKRIWWGLLMREVN